MFAVLFIICRIYNDYDYDGINHQGQFSKLEEISFLFEKSDLYTSCLSLIVNNPQKERPPSAPKQEKTAPTPTKGKAKGKEKPGTKDKKMSESSRPPSQQFDVSKPHWILRFVSDAAAAVSVPMFSSFPSTVLAHDEV